jgi:hypothetical protein
MAMAEMSENEWLCEHHDENPKRQPVSCGQWKDREQLKGKLWLLVGGGGAKASVPSRRKLWDALR